jgi:hypothetical protein
MYPVQQQFYSATLREKAGELHGLRRLDEVSKEFLLPSLIALPLSEKENSKLTLETVVKREVGKILHNWGNRVCLWDPRFLKFDEEDAVKDGIWLERLVSQFQRFGARVIPVVGMREEIHRTFAIANYARKASSGIAIRIDFDDIQEYQLLEVALTNLKSRPEECILIVDITDADTSEHDEFAKSLIGWLFALKDRGNWAKIILSGCSFPRKNPAPDDGYASSPRSEWRLWKWAVGLEPTLREFVIFGDYGADNAYFRFDGGGRPIPHLRYASIEDCITMRGDTSYASMRSVTKRIVELAHFRGRDFSDGDEFIADCSAERIRVGDPTLWRAVNMNHHMTLIIMQLAELYGIRLLRRRKRHAQQFTLFSER